MSRVAKNQYPLPQGVTATMARRPGHHQGRQGHAEPAAVPMACPWPSRTRRCRSSFRQGEGARIRAGSTRAHLANMVTGVTKGYERSSSWWASAIRAAVQGKTLNLTLGFSHAGGLRDPRRHHHRDADARPKS